MKISIISVLILIWTPTKYGYVLLYETETSEPWEYSDCLYYHSTDGSMIKYCLRPGNRSLTEQNFTTCVNDAERWLFSDLLAQGISPNDILQWSSGIETVDSYARIYYNQSERIDLTDEFLCNCTQAGSFGKYCEYNLLFGTFSINESLNNQFEIKKDIIENQRWATIVCYETLLCDFGLLCLDWRNICDREQQCMDGLDEESCDKLEFNECEEGEFRCDNGMCIAEIYFLDGEYDQ